jgi:hypothetical protein
MLQPEATGAGMEVTKCLKPSGVNQRAIFASDQHELLPVVLMLG